MLVQNPINFGLFKSLYKMEIKLAPPALQFPGAKFFSHVKFLHVNNMWDFSLFIEREISDKN